MLDKSAITKAAQKYAAKGQIDRAIAEWEMLLKESPDGNVYNLVGDLYLKKKAKREAADAFKKAANIFREDGFYLKAIALYKKILNVSPLEVDSLIALAELNAEKGLISNATESFLSAAEIYLKEGATEKALEIYEEILKLTPSNVDLKVRVAELYQKIGLKEEAIKEYLSIASYYLEKGEYQKAQEFYLRVIGYNSQSIPSHIGLSKIAEKLGDIKQAYEYLSKAISFAPDDRDILLNYSRLSIETDNLDNAKEALTKLVKIEPFNNQHKKNLGTIYLKEGMIEKAWENLLPYIDEALGAGRWDESQELLDNFKELDPVAVKRRLITIYKGKNDKDAAINELRALIEICENKDLHQDALQLYRELLELTPADEDVQIRIKELEKQLGVEKPPIPFEERAVEEIISEVDGYIGQGQLEDAISLLEKLRDREQDSVEIHIKLKDLYVKSEEKDKAIGECLTIAELYEKQGNIEAKNTIIAEALSLNPEDPRLVAISMPSVEVEEVAEGAVPSAKEAVEKFEESMAEADFYAQQGLKDEAIAIYERLLSTQPDNKELIKKLRALKPAEVGKREPVEKTAAETAIDGDLKDIFQEFKKGIEGEVGEKDGETRYNLGIAYKEMGLLEDAIREFEIAAKDPKKSLQSSSMLALCHMEKKSYPLAIQEFKKVLESMEPTDEGYLGAKCDLADAYVKNKENDKALELYKEIYSQNPKFRDVARKVEIIKKLELKGKEKPKSKKDRVSYI